MKKIFYIWGLLIACFLTMTGCRSKSAEAISSYESKETEADNGMIEIDGVQYVPKKNIETYLFMGVDAPGKVEKVEEYGESSMCDVLILMVRDLSTATYQTLAIDRNTMTDVKCIDVDGTYLATTVNQISYAHSEGDGMELSCENVADAVSNLLGGQKIDGYAAVNMGAIGTINNLAGGITVTIEDDFSAVDPTMKIGETITLTDEQAVHFVRGRMNVGDGTNESRIRRQSAYMAQLEPRLKELCNADGSFPMTVYEALEDYMVTNISMQKFSKIALLAAKDKSEGELRIEGESIEGELDYIEFWPDEDSLQEVIVRLFYKKYN